MMNALAVTRDGVPLGLIDQLWWNREPVKARAKRERERDLASTRFEDKETFHVIRAARNAVDRLAAEGVRVWIVIDRGAYAPYEERRCVTS